MFKCMHVHASIYKINSTNVAYKAAKYRHTAVDLLSTEQPSGASQCQERHDAALSIRNSSLSKLLSNIWKLTFQNTSQPCPVYAMPSATLLRHYSNHSLLLLYHGTIAARLIVELSPLQVWWNGTCFQTHSGTLLGVSTVSDWLWKLVVLRHKGTISASEALHDAPYKSKTTTTTIKAFQPQRAGTRESCSRPAAWSTVGLHRRREPDSSSIERRTSCSRRASSALNRSRSWTGELVSTHLRHNVSALCRR